MTSGSTPPNNSIAASPSWFIYPKGKSHSLTENDIREIALHTGIVDTKVAALFPKLTALRFVKRRTSP